MPLNKNAVTGALASRAGKQLKPEHIEKFGPRTIPSDVLLIEERISKTGALMLTTATVDGFMATFGRAANMTYAALIAENDIIRDAAGAIIETRANAQGWKKHLDQMRADGLIS